MEVAILHPWTIGVSGGDCAVEQILQFCLWILAACDFAAQQTYICRGNFWHVLQFAQLFVSSHVNRGMAKALSQRSAEGASFWRWAGFGTA